jgi:hypothetical protein
MNPLKYVSLIPLVLVCCIVQEHGAMAQNFKDRIVKVSETYNAAKNFHLTMTVRIAESETSRAFYFDEKADIKKQGDFYAYTFGPNHLLMNARYLVVADMEEQQILCAPRTMAQEKEFLSKTMQYNFDSLLSVMGESVFVGKKGQLEHFRVKHKDEEILQTDFYIDPVANLLRKLEYRYTEGQYMVVEFHHFNASPVFDKSTFSERRYFYIEKGEYKPSAAFRGFIVTKMEGS